MTSAFVRISTGIVVVAVPIALALPCPAQKAWYPGQSIVWQNAQSPYTPSDGAIVGGPGADPDPGSPMYVCRAMYRGSRTPGKWVKGNCNISYGGREYVMHQYQVAYGNAYWRRWDGTPNGLAQTGTEADGSPLYSCRVHYYAPASGPIFPSMPPMPGPDMNPPPMPGPPNVPTPPSIPNMPNMPGMNWQGGGNGGTDMGFQPGKIVNGNCDFPLGGKEIVQQPPFQALYGSGGGYPPYYPYPPYVPNQPSYPPSAPVTPPLGPSSVTWESEQAPFTPGQGAVEGGPGDGPTPGSPLYVCRAGANGGLYPGKWIQGQCSISANGRELKMNTYDVAFGGARWGSYGGLTSDLIQGGFDSDQNPIFVCRVPHFNFWFKDRGAQPGKLVNGQCLVSYGGSEIPVDPPFQALYSTAGEESQAPPAAPAQQQQQSSGIQVVFQSGTTSSGGKITIMNGASGQTVTEPLAPNLDLAGCVSILQKAAFEAGLQIQAQAGGLKIFGVNNSVNVSGASVSVTQF
jgi:hypothetical protein